VTPTVSIVVPAYNHEAFLDARLASVFGQTVTDTEVILLDDASPDSTANRLRKEGNRKNVSLCLSTTNSGSPFAQWNRGVEMARGQWIWIAESDDDAETSLLERLLTAAESDNAIVVSCHSRLIDANDKDGGILQHDAFPNNARWESNFATDGLSELKNYLYIQNTIPSASGVLFRRESYPGSDASFRLAGDWLTWGNMLTKGVFSHVAEPLNRSRVHAQTQRVGTIKTAQLEREATRVQANFRKICTIPPSTRFEGAQRYATSMRQGIQAGRYRITPLQLAHFTSQLAKASPTVALRFAASLPRALTAALWNHST
jgi:glycosyltransferase involved in cell wall biosynthesis